MTTDSNIVEDIFKTKEGYNECDHCQSVLSPAAYFVKLVETIEKYIPGHKLKERRPDLFELPLDCNSTSKTKLYLEIANEIMEKNLNSKLVLGVYALQKLGNTNEKIKTHLDSSKMSYENLHKDLSLARELGISYEDCKPITSKEDLETLAGTKYPSISAYLKKHNTGYEDLYKKLSLVKELDISKEDYQLITSNILQKLATAKYPFNLPANFPLVSIRAYLEKQGITLADLYKVLKPEANNVAESLGLSPEEYELITSTSSNSSEVYGASDSELKNAEKFTAQTNIDHDKLWQLIDCYNKIKKPTNELSIHLGTIDNIDQALGLLHRFIRLANKLNWSFDELCNVLLAIDKNEIGANSLKEISRIKSLQERLKKPLSEVCKLYPSASISIEENKNEEDAKNAVESLFFLQGVKESDLKKIYGIEEPSEPFREENFDEFIVRTGAKRQEVEWLLSQSTTQVKKAKKQEKISVKEQKFLHNFYQLTERFKLLFKKLGELTTAVPKDLITNVDNSIILQKIWNISKEELASLINYNDKTSSKTGKLLILEVHKQILLARLMNISIAEVIQILLQLNISELTINNVEHVIELSDWLSNNSITIEQLSKLVNSSALSHQYTEQISKICEELEKDQELKRDEKAFHNLVLQYIGEQLNEEGLAATHEFTKKQPTNLQLLRLESLDKSIVHDVGIIGQKAIFLGESKVHNKSSVEHSINEPRENVAVATVGKKTIFFGGKKSTNEYSKKIDIYDEGTGSWSNEIASEARDSAAAAVVESKAIFFGGNKSSSECSAKIDIYNDNATNESEKWKADQYQTSEARANASVAVIGEKAIFFGGEVGQGRSGKIDIYDNKTGQWRSSDTASEARTNASVAVVDTKVIFFGGNKGDQCSSKVDIYDSKTGKWTMHIASEARENASVAVVDGKAIFFGGKAGETRSNKIDIYDAKTDKWLEVEHTAGEARDAASVTVVGKQAVFFGGCKGNQQHSKYIDVYDSPTNKWKKTDEINEAHESVSAIAIGTKAIFFTGKKSSTVTGQVYIYDSTSYFKDEDIAKSWIKRTAKETETQDDLLVNITNSTKYCGKIDIHDNTTKSWKAIDLYKPDKCKSIRIHNNRATLTYQDMEGSTYDRTYTVGLSITYDATIEELLNNVTVFTTFKMDAEDITNHANAYKLKVTWTEEQIKTLANYKALQNEFSGNELTLSQYREWLRDSYDERKVTEKIAQLTNWDKKVLNKMKEIDSFKKYFSKEHNPLNSLLKIKSFMDMSERSAIGGEILLKLKDLNNLPASTGWNKYDSTAKKLQESLSYVEGVKEHLEDQKRNILANYMLHTYPEIKNKNMRELYAFLLIDVEMSDCSKISPLKAGLNSLQLYIHRCILKLEKDSTVSTELTEEMWDLLDNYREWEATKKVALYPENYLNPTLRKSATAEYKALQNTLMQGNLTNEEADNAYIKYFEDFSQLVNLKVVDVCHTVEKEALYVIGRTEAEPYIYYFRGAHFSVQNENNPSNWTPWEKIEIQIPVEKAKVAYAFDKIFVFWLQRTEREKDIEGISISDSVLNVYYIFKKIDGSWSAQQKILGDIKIDYEYERKIRHKLSIKYYLTKCIEHYRNREKGEENPGLKEIWTSIIERTQDGVEQHDKSIKETAQASKDINKGFQGELIVNYHGDKVLITSREAGFENSRFTLKKDLSLGEQVNVYLSNSDDNREKAIKSIEDFYTKKTQECEEENENKNAEKEKRTGSKKEAVKSLEGDVKKSKKVKEEKEELLVKVKLINNTKTEEKNRKEENLQKKISDIKAELDDLQTQKTINDGLPKVLVEKGALRAAFDSLQQRLTKSMEFVQQDIYILSSKSAILTQLQGLETKLKGLTNEMSTLMREIVRDLERETDEATKGIDIGKLQGEIAKLETEIEQKEEKIKKLNAEISSLCSANTGSNLQMQCNELDARKQQEIKLVEDLFNQKEKISKIGGIKDEEIINLIYKLYGEAYSNGLVILTSREDLAVAKFSGFYGVYLWEIFFHIPTLVAYLFNQEQKFAEARKWYQYIFNPLKEGCYSWQFAPFKTKCQNSESNSEKCDSGELVDLLDPYKEADKKKISYEKYIIISYIDNLIDWGDMLFSQNSWEGINQATMLYIRAWDLLGEKPKKKGKRKSEPKNVCGISDGKIQALCAAETTVPTTTHSSTSSSATTYTTEYCNYFCTPENKDFIGLWDRIEDRLYKIRHCLDIKGKRLELPLFQPPIDPRQLISAAADGSTIMLPKIAQVPHYRFRYMITYAKSISDTVTQIGSELLSVLEKKDAEALTLLYNKQEGIMANLMTIIKEKAIEALKEEAKALNASLNSAKDRKSHYEKLIHEGLSDAEIAAMAAAVSSTTALGLAVAPAIITGALSLIPNIFGLACGGSKFEGVAKSTTDSIVLTSNTLSNISQNISTYASYERRAQDWDLQKIMATHDFDQISHQIEANKINQASAEQDLKAHKESIKQIREKESFFRSKFTNQELYSWMKGELKSLYIRVYRLALEIARQAERAYQYEIDNDKTFIQPGHWNSLKEGLLSGHKLKFELEQLDKEYHDTNERRLEITKVISLKSLDSIALYELKTQGKCQFSFTEKLFDLDFPGHYARKIKDIKITIPAVVGPYENVHASLQQTSSQVILKSDSAINAIKYLVNPSEEEQPETDLLRVNWKPNQEIAISKADQDSGLFELSFGDERYLPFEGTGAISTWELSLPQATNRFDISTISDVIIHLDYTALNGGEVLSRQVKNLDQIKYYQGTLVVNLSAVYPAEWDKFKQQAKGSSSELKFKLSPEMFPFHVKNPSVDLDGKNNICVIPTTPDMSRITIKVNNYSWERNSKKIVNPSLTIGNDWIMKINNADTNKIEEIMIMVPYKAPINW